MYELAMPTFAEKGEAGSAAGAAGAGAVCAKAALANSADKAAATRDCFTFIVNLQKIDGEVFVVRSERSPQFRQ